MLRKIGDMRVRDVLQILITNKEGEEVTIPYRISKFLGKTGVLLKLADDKFKGIVKNKIKTSFNKIKNSKKIGRLEKFKYNDD